MSIIMGSLMIGQLSALSPDFGKGRIGAAHLFKLFNRVPAIDSASESGVKPVSSTNLDFCDACNPDPGNPEIMRIELLFLKLF